MNGVDLKVEVFGFTCLLYSYAQLQGSVPESAVVRARRVRQQWRRAVERVLAANRFGAVQRDSDAQRELLSNLAAVFNVFKWELLVECPRHGRVNSCVTDLPLTLLK